MHAIELTHGQRPKLILKTLEPIIAQYKKDHPPPPWRPLPLCKGQ
jgi:hypothetical protein